jgi:hypothetical protein
MRNGTQQNDIRSELEDWFMAFAEVRNEIIHEGTLSTHIYEAPPERPLSRYAGPLFWTADRVLREAVKALLGAEVLLCAQLRRAAEMEKLGALLQAAMDAERNSAAPDGAASDSAASDSAAPDVLASGTNTAISDEDATTFDVIDVETASPEPDDYSEGDDVEEAGDESSAEPDTRLGAPVQTDMPVVSDRDLSALLAALKCDAANKVRLKKVVAQSVTTRDGARENARAAQGRWSASFEKRSIMINRAERDVLEAAGAEFSLPRYWARCE